MYYILYNNFTIQHIIMDEQLLRINESLLQFHTLLSELKSNSNKRIFLNYCDYAMKSHSYYMQLFNDTNKHSTYLIDFNNILRGSVDNFGLFNLMIIDYYDVNIEHFINSLSLNFNNTTHYSIVEKQLHIYRLLLKFHIHFSKLCSYPDYNNYLQFFNYAINTHKLYKKKFNDANKLSHHLLHFNHILNFHSNVECIYIMVFDFNDQNIELFINSLLSYSPTIKFDH
jgi:hypothetical protein